MKINKIFKILILSVVSVSLLSSVSIASLLIAKSQSDSNSSSSGDKDNDNKDYVVDNDFQKWVDENVIVSLKEKISETNFYNLIF